MRKLTFTEAATALLAQQSGGERTPEAIAGAATRSLERLCQHLARIVGEAGILTILGRSVALASATYPWLAASEPRVADPWTRLRRVLAEQQPEVAADAFVSILVNMVTLLGRFIGDGLVTRLLAELWPDIFVPVDTRGPHD